MVQKKKKELRLRTSDISVGSDVIVYTRNGKIMSKIYEIVTIDKRKYARISNDNFALYLVQFGDIGVTKDGLEVDIGECIH
jgi:hypothetical protein